MTITTLMRDVLPPGWKWVSKPVLHVTIYESVLECRLDDGKRIVTVNIATDPCPYRRDAEFLGWLRQVLDLELLWEASR